MNKKCSKCSEVKEIELFFKDKGFSDGHASVCKECKKKSTYIWREKNKGKYNAYMRKIRSEQKDYFKNVDLKRTYGIGLDIYKAMQGAQENKCAICGKGPQGKRPLVVDHNHDTGSIRALLCYGCNRALHILESPELLAKASAYLKKHNPA